MGLSKLAMMESEERGWDAEEKFVCSACVDDEFLKDCIEDNVAAHMCDYCGSQEDKHVAAPVKSIMGPISDALYSNFAEPYAAGVPRDEGEFVANTTNTLDALLSLPLDCHQDLFDDVMCSFHNLYWVECSNGIWLSEHDSTKWRWDWENFERIVKTRIRYFFSSNASEGSEYLDEYSSPEDLLNQIGVFIKSLGLYKELATGTRLFRVRKIKGGENLDSFEQLGPPPSSKASAGRMNPAGISYFYLAREKRTAIGEVLNCPPCKATIATFVSKYDMVFLDLAKLPELPSVFDVNQHHKLEVLVFLNEFVRAISQPTAKDGREHVDYVPSQIVSEYFAKVFVDNEIGRINGMIYPSSVVPGGQNIVIFPPRNTYSEEWKKSFELAEVDQIIARDWEALLSVISETSSYGYSD